jgi:hypothetical protein
MSRLQLPPALREEMIVMEHTHLTEMGGESARDAHLARAEREASTDAELLRHYHQYYLCPPYEDVETDCKVVEFVFREWN